MPLLAFNFPFFIINCFPTNNHSQPFLSSMKFACLVLLFTLLNISAFSRSCVRRGASETGSRPCYVTGCSGQVCSARRNVATTCEWKEEYTCYASATCERQRNGRCGWTQTEELQQCIEDARNPPSNGPCYVGGCSGQLCTDHEGAISTCEWTEAYACYRDATCERQSNGRCGWTQTDELQECLDNAS